MRTLANQHYLGEKDTPAHWSGPAQRYQESLIKINESIAEGIARSPEPFRETMAAMNAELIQLRKMVSEGVIRAMVKDEFWTQYAQVPINVEAAVKITNRLVDELGHYELRAIVNDAVAPKIEKSEAA